jgi:hypothetical protein
MASLRSWKNLNCWTDLGANQMPWQKAELINIADMKDVQRWMRRLNISKEELLLAVEKFGPSADAVSIGLQRTSGRPIFTIN